MKGFFDQLFRINLSGQKSTVGPIPESILQPYLGDRENDPAPRSESDTERILPMKGPGV
jgi:hypothetical protein